MVNRWQHDRRAAEKSAEEEKKAGAIIITVKDDPGHFYRVVDEGNGRLSAARIEGPRDVN